MKNTFVIAGSIIIAALIISYFLPSNRYQSLSPAALEGDVLIIDTKNKSNCVVTLSKTKGQEPYIRNGAEICKP
ncbi:hypothetical protein OAL80_02195 [Pelagibacteraceae bacterium]|nr:hypothetical protein [Pelagibacteraceae bacterium]